LSENKLFNIPVIGKVGCLRRIEQNKYDDETLVDEKS
jgi:hypothetical protein